MASNNIALHWALSDADFSQFDSSHRQAMKLASLPDHGDLSIRSRPTPFDKRRLAESLKRIAESDPTEISARISALQAIVKVAPKFIDISYADCEMLTNYIFAANNQREKLEIERALPNLSTWSNLKLAIVDHFSTNNDVSKSELFDILQRLGTKLLTDHDDRMAIHGFALEVIAGEINERHRNLIAANQWELAEPRINRLLLQRARLLYRNTAVIEGDYVAAVLSGIERMAKQDRQQQSSLVRTVEFVKNSDIPGMEKIVQANEILTRMFQQYENQTRVEWTTLLTSVGDLNYAQRLLVSELLLMQVLNDDRKKWLERINGQ